MGSLWTTRTPEAPRPKRVEVWGITCKCAPNAQHVHPAGAAGDPRGLPAILLPFPAELSPSGAGGGESLVPQAGDSRMTARGGPGQAGGGRVFAGRPGPLGRRGSLRGRRRPSKSRVAPQVLPSTVGLNVHRNTGLPGRGDSQKKGARKRRVLGVRV